MAKGIPREPLGPQTTPQRYADVPPPQQHPSGDYSYTLEIVMGMTKTLGQLDEAVDSLKEKAKSHGDKLEKIGQEIHSAKFVIGLVGGFIGLVGIFLGIVLKSVLDYLLRTQLK